jgi:hypothetical protein
LDFFSKTVQNPKKNPKRRFSPHSMALTLVGLAYPSRRCA